MEFGEKIADGVAAAETWLAKHPLVFDVLCVAVLGMAALRFLEAAEIVVGARREAAEIQRAASEALGG